MANLNDAVTYAVATLDALGNRAIGGVISCSTGEIASIANALRVADTAGPVVGPAPAIAEAVITLAAEVAELQAEVAAPIASPAV